MRAGQLRHRINVERLTGTKNGFGEVQPTWTPILTRYPARVRDDSQREYSAQMQVQDEKTIHIEIRDPRVKLFTKDRVTFTHPVNGATVYDIRAILAGENVGRDLVLTCSEHSTEQ